MREWVEWLEQNPSIVPSINSTARPFELWNGWEEVGEAVSRWVDEQESLEMSAVPYANAVQDLDRISSSAGHHLGSAVTVPNVHSLQSPFQLSPLTHTHKIIDISDDQDGNPHDTKAGRSSSSSSRLPIDVERFSAHEHDQRSRIPHESYGRENIQESMEKGQKSDTVMEDAHEIDENQSHYGPISYHKEIKREIRDLLDAAVSPSNLTQDLVHCYPSPKLDTIFRGYQDLPEICAEFARCMLLAKLLLDWHKLAGTDWREKLREVYDAMQDRSKNLRIWTPLQNWLVDFDKGATPDGRNMDHWEGSELADKKMMALEKLTEAAREVTERLRVTVDRLLEPLGECFSTILFPWIYRVMKENCDRRR